MPSGFVNQKAMKRGPMSGREANNGQRGIIILSHGSRVRKANDTLKTISRMLEDRSGQPVSHAYMSFSQPTLSEAVSKLLGRGLSDLVVLPLFLFPGIHGTKDIPRMVREERHRWPAAKIRLGGVVGGDQRLVDILASRLQEAVPEGALEDVPSDMGPAAIERESRRLAGQAIQKVTRQSGLVIDGPAQLRVMERVVRTVGDPAIASTMRFSKAFAEKSVEALSNGSDVVCDVRMVEAGINRKSLGRLGGRVRCGLGLPGVEVEAAERGATRCSVGMEKVLLACPEALIAVGNAPTALRAAGRLLSEGKIKPAAIIGVPVGFVGAAEIKAELVNWGLPYVTIGGTRGGSTVAAAIVNALLELASGSERPLDFESKGEE